MYEILCLSTPLRIRFLLQHQNNTLDSVYRLTNNDEKFNCLPCIYWLLKMHKILSGARFIMAGKKGINKQLSKHVTSAFKLCYDQIDLYHKNHVILVGPKPFGLYKITPFI